LNHKTLENFNKMQKRAVSMDKREDDDLAPMVDKADFENEQIVANKKPPIHKDYGKIPKYLAKYKDEA